MSFCRAFYPRKYSPSFRIVNVLRVLWLIAIAWYELGTFYYHVHSCAWPDGLLNAASDPSPTHVLLVADPQVLDHRSYPGRPPWLMTLSQLMVDLNMRKSWWATKQLRAQVVIFLGDMMDGGRFAMPEAEYEAYYQRFKSIFAREGVATYYISGNHDVGLGTLSDFSDKADERYISHFGPLNQMLEIGNHTFVLIDAPGLVEEDYQRSNEGMSYAHWAASVPGGPIAFIQQSSVVAGVMFEEKMRNPTILLTHIPLARYNTACGPLREKGTIRAGTGHGYQNTLTAQASQFLLQNIRPSIIFSGDDHDYCEHDHLLPPSDDIPLAEHRSVREVTVKSFSMAMGVRRPGFQLLSLAPASLAPFGVATAKTLDDAPCILPDQLGIYLSVYVPLIVLSIGALFVSNAIRVRSRGASHSGSTFRLATRRAPPDEDASSSSAHKLSTLSLPMRRFDEGDNSDDDDDDDTPLAYILPPPTPAVTVTGKNKRLQRTRLTICGKTVDVSAIRHPFLYFRFSRGGATSRRKRRGLLNGVGNDVLSVACTPIVLFVAIAWFMFQ